MIHGEQTQATYESIAETNTTLYITINNKPMFAKIDIDQELYEMFCETHPFQKDRTDYLLNQLEPYIESLVVKAGE